MRFDDGNSVSTKPNQRRAEKLKRLVRTSRSLSSTLGSLPLPPRIVAA